MNWANFENGIQGQVATALGLSGAKVIWENQSRARPSRTFASLSILNVSSPSTHTYEETYDTGGTPAAGEEITLASTEHYDVTVSVTVYTSAVIGATSARAYAEAVRAHFGKEATVYALDALAEPIAIVERGTVKDVSALLETEIEGRAVVEFGFRVGSKVTELETYIETIDADGTFEV